MIRRSLLGYLSIVLSVFICCQTAIAAEYWVATDGNDNNPGTDAAPWATFAHAFKTMSGGDTLWVKDGEYREGIGSYKTHVPSGTADHYTEVKAVNDHKVTINMSGIASEAIYVSQDSYIKLRGFRCHSTTGDRMSVVRVDGHHIELRVIGAWDYFVPQGSSFTGGSTFVVGTNDYPGEYTHDILVEDCWAFGRGRYSFIGYNAYNITWRRCVARPDHYVYESGWPVAGMNVGYNCKNVIVENCIVLNVPAFGTSEANNASHFYFNVSSATAWGNDNIKFFGCIALNNQAKGGTNMRVGDGFRYDPSYTTLSKNCSWENCVFWDTGGSGLRWTSGPTENWSATNITVGAIGNYASDNVGIKVASGIYTNALVKNSLFTDFSDESAGYAVGVWGTADVTLTYNAENNTAGYKNFSCTTGCKFDQDPKLKYIVRIEKDSPLYGAGEGGKNIGATVLKRYENGVLTSQDLWPFPHEDWIQEDMRLSAKDGKRGFCASGQTLTKYIWEYLGNPIPPEIYLNAPTSPDAYLIAPGIKSISIH